MENKPTGTDAGASTHVITGLVDDVRTDALDNADVLPAFYTSAVQEGGQREMWVVLRARQGAPLKLTRAIRDAVHLAAQSLPVDNAVHLAAGRLLIGRSVHALDEAIAAARDGADYVTFGHVFPTSTHPGLPPRGLAELKAIVEAVDIPVLAIGGITVTNLDQVLSTGCAGVAVISAILSEADPCRAAASLRRALDASVHQPRHQFPSPQRRPPHAAHHQPATV